MKKSYKLTYEPVQIPRAVFDPRSCRNRWKIAAYVLKTFSDFFGPRAENLDICYDEGKAVFTCYTEKVVYKDGRVVTIVLYEADFDKRS